MLNPGKMEYRTLGNTGLKVSVISFGNMINSKPENEETDRNIIKACLQNGINYFDTAELYDAGKCEETLGKHLKELKVERENIVVSTKIWTTRDPERNSTTNTNRKHIRQSVDKSLKRLQLDYVDVLFAHAWDEETPIEEICRAFNEVIQQGKAFYWATSNWHPEYVLQAFGVCERLNLHKPIAAQNQYNMIVREDMETAHRTIFQKYNYGTTIWSPLGGGFLTGKYLDGLPKDGNHRIVEGQEDLKKKIFYDSYVSNPKNIERLKELKEFAEKELNTKLHNLALAWVIKFKYTSTAIVGARSVQQLLDSLTSLELAEKLTPEVQGKVNKILGNNPALKINMVTQTPFPPLRPVAE